jgi:Uma2 family endonuclease
MAVTLLRGPFTVHDYHRLAECGILDEHDRVELIDGQVVEMSPIGPRHAACVDRLTRLLARSAGPLAVVRVQNPLTLESRAEPLPDVALLRLPIERYAGAHPRSDDVLLVIEVADTSADYDRDVKIPLYARASIPEAWLVSLPSEEIEVYRKPSPQRYAEVRRTGRGDTLTPLLLEAITLEVDEILGRTFLNSA